MIQPPTPYRSRAGVRRRSEAESRDWIAGSIIEAECSAPARAGGSGMQSARVAQASSERHSDREPGSRWSAGKGGPMTGSCFLRPCC